MTKYDDIFDFDLDMKLNFLDQFHKDRNGGIKNNGRKKEEKADRNIC